jgi:hypothetical protein
MLMTSIYDELKRTLGKGGGISRLKDAIRTGLGTPAIVKDWLAQPRTIRIPEKAVNGFIALCGVGGEAGLKNICLSFKEDIVLAVGKHGVAKLQLHVRPLAPVWTEASHVLPLRVEDYDATFDDSLNGLLLAVATGILGMVGIDLVEHKVKAYLDKDQTYLVELDGRDERLDIALKLLQLRYVGSAPGFMVVEFAADPGYIASHPAEAASWFMKLKTLSEVAWASKGQVPGDD